MAALPVYLLILGALTQASGGGEIPHFSFVCVCLNGFYPDDSFMIDTSLTVPRDSFSFDSVASKLILPLLDAGYAFASLTVARSELVSETLLMHTELIPGPAVEVASLGFAGEYQTSPRLLAHLAGFRPFIYSTADIRRLVENLDNIGCEAGDHELVVLASTDSTASARLNLLIEENRVPNRLTAGLGYSRDEGVVGSAEVALFNLFGGRRRLSLTWRQLARNDLNFACSARDPYPFNLPVGIEGQAAFRSFDASTYHLQGSLGGFYATPSVEIGLGYSYQQDRDSENRVVKNLAYTRAEVAGFSLNVYGGQRRFETSSAYVWAGGMLNLPLKLPWGFSFYLQPAGALVNSTDSLFTTELVAVGGARSVRGYAEEEFRTELVLWSRQELRWGSEAFSFYPLFDAAWVQGEGFLAGYGAGIAVVTPVGRLELDAALPWAGAWNEAKLHLSLAADF